MSQTKTRTMTLGEFSGKYAICRVWMAGHSCQAGEEIVISDGHDGDEERYWIEQSAWFRQASKWVGEVSRDADGEMRWEPTADAWDDGLLRSGTGGNFWKLTVWGEADLKAGE